MNRVVSARRCCRPAAARANARLTVLNGGSVSANSGTVSRPGDFTDKAPAEPASANCSISASASRSVLNARLLIVDAAALAAAPTSLGGPTVADDRRPASSGMRHCSIYPCRTVRASNQFMLDVDGQATGLSAQDGGAAGGRAGSPGIRTTFISRFDQYRAVRRGSQSSSSGSITARKPGVGNETSRAVTIQPRSRQNLYPSASCRLAESDSAATGSAAAATIGTGGEQLAQADGVFTVDFNSCFIVLANGENGARRVRRYTAWPGPVRQGTARSSPQATARRSPAPSRSA